MKRNRLEISVCRFPLKADALAEANKIISNRKDKLNKAREPYHEAVRAYQTAEKNATELSGKLKTINEKQKNFSGHSDELIKIVEERDKIAAELNTATSNKNTLFAAIEPARIKKQSVVKKLNIKAWQLQEVKYTGKHGHNWVFQSER